MMLFQWEAGEHVIVYKGKGRDWGRRDLIPHWYSVEFRLDDMIY